MDTIKIIQIFNKVITSKELDRKIIYKFLNHILSKHNIILVEGDIYIKEIRSHIVDNTINNNYLIRVNKNQFFSLGINENFDKIDYVLRTYYDLFEEITKLKLENEELFSSTHAIINHKRSSKINIKEQRRNSTKKSFKYYQCKCIR